MGKEKSLRPALRRLLYAVLITALATALFLAVTYRGWAQVEQRIQLLMRLGLLAGLGALYLGRKKLNGLSFVTAVILVGGLVMRFGYALYTPATLRVHDLGAVDIGDTGHAAYVLNIFLRGALPPSNAYQFSEPPLYYALSALCMKIYALGSGVGDPATLFEAARLPSLLASCGALLLGYRLGRELGLRERSLNWMLAVCAFLPNHYLLAGRANPDSLAVFFIYLIVLYAVRWYRRPERANTVWLALGFGLGMMTKMVVAVLAFPVGAMMLFVFWQRCVRGGRWALLRQYGLFLLLACPLGLWYPVRNAVLYAQPFDYVYPLSINHSQYIGDVSRWSRFVCPNLHALFTPLYVDAETCGNVIVYTAKSAVFGEFSFDIDPAVPYVLFGSNLALMVLSFAATARVAVASVRRRQAERLLLVGIWLGIFGAYLLFNLRYPFYCSMDFRYMVGTSLIGGVMLALSNEAIPSDRLAGKAYRALVTAALILFSAASVVMYTAVS